MNPVKSILHRSLYDGSRPLNILTSPTHEAYEENLAKTGHNFYAYGGEHIKTWNTDYRKLPNNYITLDRKRKENQLLKYVDFDLILSQQKFGQFQVLAPISRKLHIPLLSLEHTDCMKEYWPEQQQRQLREMRGHMNVFISEYSVNRWGWDDRGDTKVIHHGIDTDIFKSDNRKRSQYLLSIVNDFIGRDYAVGFTPWKQITQTDPKLPVRVRGDTKGLSTPTANLQELVEEYRNAQIFLNTSLLSPIPTVVLESMACECAIISTATGMIPSIIKNGVNGYCSNDINQLRRWCEELLNNLEKCAELGRNARKTIQEKFSLDRFVKEWDETFKAVAKIPILR